MSADLFALPRHVLLAGLAAAAGFISILAWRALTEDFAAVTLPLLLLAVLVAGTGALGRWMRWPAYVLVPLQVVIAAVTVLAATTGSLVPTASTIEAMVAALQEAAQSARAEAAPVPAGVAPVHPLLLVAGAAVLVGVDVCVGTLRRASVSGLVLLAVHALPVMITGAGVAWWIFVAAGTAYLGVVFLQHGDLVRGWGRPMTTTESGAPAASTGSSARTALVLGATSIVVALVVPVVTPSIGVALLEGQGPGSRSGKVEVVNPMVDLRRDLTRGQDMRLLRVATDAGQPSYLRLSVLTRFNDGRWTPGDRTIPEDQVAVGELPALDGVSLNLRRTRNDYRVQVWLDFHSTWLPTTEHVSEIDAGEDWRYDVATRDFIATGSDTDTAGLDYTFTGITLDYDAASMNAAGSGSREVPSVFSQVPVDLDDEVRELAASVTASAPTRFQKAQALQRWFRQTGGFRYDLAPAESLGSGTADLVAFLDEETGRVGYCEQFAASMAIMARTLGIPSRVAVGFLEPSQVGSGEWEFSAWDLHAWPELYFPGSGWVRFEPTPSARTGQAPNYTTREIAVADPTASPSPTQSSAPSPGQESTTAPEPEADAGANQGGVPWRVVAAALALVLIGATAGLLPGALRRRRREERLASGIEGIWEEVHAVLVDLDHEWPEGQSPRRTGTVVAKLLARPTDLRNRPERPRRGPDRSPEATAALSRLVSALERDRYARTPGSVTTQSLVEDFSLVESSLRSGVSARGERGATWWPKSVTRRDQSGLRDRHARAGDASALPSAP